MDYNWPFTRSQPTSPISLKVPSQPWKRQRPSDVSIDIRWNLTEMNKMKLDSNEYIKWTGERGSAWSEIKLWRRFNTTGSSYIFLDHGVPQVDIRQRFQLLLLLLFMAVLCDVAICSGRWWRWRIGWWSWWGGVTDGHQQHHCAVVVVQRLFHPVRLLPLQFVQVHVTSTRGGELWSRYIVTYTPERIQTHTKMEKYVGVSSLI